MSSESGSRRGAFVTSRPSFIAEELRPLLQSRLRLACLLAFAVLGLLFANELLFNPLRTARVYFTLIVEGLNVVIFGCGALWLWRVREVPITQLRLFEIIVVIGFAVSNALGEYLWLIGGGVAKLTAAPAITAMSGYWTVFDRDSMRFTYADGALMISIGWAFPWTALLAAYTGWIPTTLRRSLILTAISYSLAFAATVAAALTRRELAWTYLTIGATMLTFMTPITILGLTAAHKLDGLRRQAFEAKRLGQYTLERKLGEGGMGEVHLARHRFLRRPCAVKLIRAEVAEAHSSVVRFEREVQAMAALTHPNTVEIFDYGRTDDGTFYYVMEYLPGLSLDELVRRCGPLSPPRIIYILQQVCDALCEAHIVGLLHRDIKPSNILICERGRRHDVAKLLDFGLVQRIGEKDEELRAAAAEFTAQVDREPGGPARSDEDALAEKVTQAGSLVGTPAYMSPEQVIGNRPLDVRSDIYSLGGVAYFLLTGRPPFGTRSTMETMAAHLAETVETPAKYRPDAPADLSAAILRCLEKDPAQRFATATSFSDALAACGCAGQWTQEAAAAWWRAYAADATEAPAAKPPGGATIEAAELVVESVVIRKI